MRIPNLEKVIPTLDLVEHDAHQICFYDIDELRDVIESSKAANLTRVIVNVIGIDCQVISDYVLLPLDVLIAEQIIKTFIGVQGLRDHNYYKQNTLLSELEK